MNLKVASGILTEIAREWGIIALRFQQAHEHKIPAEQCAREFIERQATIKALFDEFRKEMRS